MVLSPYSTPTDLEPLAAVREPRKGGGGNGLKTTTTTTTTTKQRKVRKGRFPSLKRKIGNPPRIVQIKTMCQMH